MSAANKLGMHTDDLPPSVSEGAFPKGGAFMSAANKFESHRRPAAERQRRGVSPKEVC